MPLTVLKYTCCLFGSLLAGYCHGQWTLESTAEYLGSDSVDVATASGILEAPLVDRLSLRVWGEVLDNRIQYRPNAPIDPFGKETSRREFMKAAQVQLAYTANRSQWTFRASVYDGFRNHASVWLDEYYRQQYGGGGLPGVQYEDPDPRGQGFELSMRQEVISGSGYLTLSLGLVRDSVAPGYEVEDSGTAFALVRGERRLDTVTGSISWEGLLNKAMRTRQSVRLTETTGRQLRYGWSGEVNWLISDHWISRSSATFARENPTFEAWSVSETIEHQLADNWFVAGTIRYYKDTGQIESANLVSSAAPALRSYQAMLSLRYENLPGSFSVSFSAGPYRTLYGKTGIGTERFQNLYQDRDWLWFRFATRYTF